MPLANIIRDRFLTLIARGGEALDWSAIDNWPQWMRVAQIRPSRPLRRARQPCLERRTRSYLAESGAVNPGMAGRADIHFILAIYASAIIPCLFRLSWLEKM